MATEDSVSVVDLYFYSLAYAITPGGSEGLRSLTNPKAVIVDRWPWLLETSIPSPLDYPIRSPLRAWWVVLLFHIHLTIMFETTI